MEHKTSKAHYERYENFCELYHIRAKNESVFGSYDKVLEAYKQDPHLNSIPLKKFDAIAMLMLHIPLSVSLADRVCMLKHTLKYDFLKLEPCFT